MRDGLVIGDGPPIPVGDAVQMVIERISLPVTYDLERIADAFCEEGDIAAQLDEVVAMCRACLQAYCVRRTLAGGQWWREVPSVLSRAREHEKADRGPLVSCRVDEVCRDGD